MRAAFSGVSQCLVTGIVGQPGDREAVAAPATQQCELAVVAVGVGFTTSPNAGYNDMVEPHHQMIDQFRRGNKVEIERIVIVLIAHLILGNSVSWVAT